jgi:hypothetical protein
MWPPFVRKKQQPTKRCFRRSGWFGGGDATEVGYVGRVLMHRFDRQVTRQKMNKQKYVDANAANKLVKIYNNQLKQSRRWWGGDFKRNAIGAKRFLGRSTVIWEGNWVTQTFTKKIYSAGVHLPLPANRESHNNQPKVVDAIG